MFRKPKRKFEYRIEKKMVCVLSDPVLTQYTEVRRAGLPQACRVPGPAHVLADVLGPRPRQHEVAGDADGGVLAVGHLGVFPEPRDLRGGQALGWLAGQSGRLAHMDLAMIYNR